MSGRTEESESTGGPCRAVYTVLLGGYENFNDELQLFREDIAFICLTDNPEITSSNWKMELVKPAFPGDSIRSQRLLKIEGHPLLDAFDELLYVDNSVTITGPMEPVFEHWLGDADICFPLHSFHSTVLDEFDAVLRLERDAYDRVSEQLFHYHASHPEVLKREPIWTGFFARRNNPGVRRLCQSWFHHVARYSRRDQLSLPFVLADVEKSVLVKTVVLDNHQSEFHRWHWTELQEARPRKLSHASHDGTLPLLAEVTRLENQLAQEQAKTSLLSGQVAELELGLQQMEDHVEAVYKTLSWRITAPLRKLRG